MPTLEQNRKFFYDVFSDTQHKFNQNQFMDVVIEWQQKNLQVSDIFPDYDSAEYHRGFIDGYDDRTEDDKEAVENIDP